MFGSTILDVAIGISFVYFLLSLICSSINELLAGFLKLRARDLQRGICNILCDDDMAKWVLNHPLIKSMGSTRTETGIVQMAAGGEVGAIATGIRRFLGWLLNSFKNAWSLVATRGNFAGSPSYISSRTFATALLDGLDQDRPGTIHADIVEQRTRALADPNAAVPDDVKNRVENELNPTGEFLTKISAAATVAELRSALEQLVEQFKDSDDPVRDKAKRILADLDARKQIGQALGSILDTSLKAGKRIVQVKDLKEMVDRLTNAADQEAVLKAFKDADTIDALKKSLGLLPEGDAKKAVLNAISEAEKGLEQFRMGIETWYDDAMDRVSGVYRRRVRWWLLVIGVVVSAIVGADTTQIYRSLKTNQQVREAVVAQAEAALEDDWCVKFADATATPTPAATATSSATPPPSNGNESSQSTNVECLEDQLNETNLGFGYHDGPGSGISSLGFWQWLGLKVVGLLLTAIAVSLGAPFWFDLLGKISNLRAAGPRPPREPLGGPSNSRQ